MTDTSGPEYTKFIESLQQSRNAKETNQILENLNLTNKMELINRFATEIQKDQVDNDLQQKAGMIFNQDFVSNLTTEVVDGIDTLEFKDISNSMGVLKAIKEPHVLTKLFMRFKTLARKVQDKRTMNQLMKCYSQLLPMLVADKTQSHELFSISDEIMVIFMQSRNTWMDSDVAGQLASLIYHSPSPAVLKYLPMLDSKIQNRPQISEIVFFNLVYCLYHSLKGSITESFESPGPVSPNPKPYSVHYKVFVEEKSISRLIPKSIEIKLLNSLERSTRHPTWRLNPDNSSLKQNVDLIFEILNSPIMKEFPAILYRLTDSYMWILKDYGHKFEAFQFIWKLDCDLTKHNFELTKTFGDQAMQFVFWITQYLAIQKIESHLRPWDNKGVLDIKESHLPFKNEESFKSKKPPSSVQIASFEAIPREVVDMCDPLLKYVVTTLVFLNKNLKDHNHMIFCREYLEKILNLLSKSLPMILIKLPDGAARRASSRESEYGKMTFNEAEIYDKELLALLHNPDNVSFIKTLHNFRELSPLLINLRGFYSKNSELSQNIQKFVIWVEKPRI